MTPVSPPPWPSPQGGGDAFAEARFGGGHVYTARVYFADTDAGGVVYHATYLAMAEAARTEALRAAGLPHAALMAEYERSFMVRRINMEYVRPARLDDLMFITTRALAETGATLTLQQNFTLERGAHAARLEVELVCVNVRSLKPARIPPAWRHCFSA